MAIDRQKIAKYYIVGSSLTLLILAVGVIGLGVRFWITRELSDYLYVLVRHLEMYARVAALCFVASGSLSLVIACLGCCGAYTRNKRLIVSYICFCAIVYAGQIVGGTIITVKAFDAVEVTKDGFKSQGRHYEELLKTSVILMTVWLGLGVLHVVGFALAWRVLWKAKENGYSDISD